MRARTSVKDVEISDIFLSPERRRTALKTYSMVLCFQLILLLYLMAVAALALKEDLHLHDCAGTFVRWFLVFICFYSIHLLITVARICVWQYNKDPPAVDAGINIAFVLILAIPELACITVGFVLLGGASDYRHSLGVSFDLTYYSALVMLIASSLFFLAVTVVLLIYGVAYYQWK